MKGLGKVLSIILLVSIIASSTIVSYGDVEDVNEFVPEIALMNKTGEDITFISGKLTEKSDELPEEIVKKIYTKDFENQKTKLDTLEFKIVDKFKNSMGRTVVKTVQVVEGVPVYGSERNFHINNEGIVEVISGKNVENISKLIKKSKSLKISEKEIIKLIEKNLEHEISIFNMSVPELVLYPVNDYEYVYKVIISVSNQSLAVYILHFRRKFDIINVEKSSTSVKTTVYGTELVNLDLLKT